MNRKHNRNSRAQQQSYAAATSTNAAAEVPPAPPVVVSEASPFVVAVGASMPLLDDFMDDDAILLPMDMDLEPKYDSPIHINTQPSNVQIIHTSTIPRRVMSQESLVIPARPMPQRRAPPQVIPIPTSQSSQSQSIPSLFNINSSTAMPPPDGASRKSGNVKPSTITTASMTTSTMSTSEQAPANGENPVPTYNVTFTGLTNAHRSLVFAIPKFFYDQCNPASNPQLSSNTPMLFRFNQRAIALQVDGSIFTDFICRLISHTIQMHFVPFLLEVQDAPSDWLNRYRCAANVNSGNYVDASRKAAMIFKNRKTILPETDPLPEPLTIHVSVRRSYLVIMAQLDYGEECKALRLLQGKTVNRRSVHTQTEVLLLPSSYMDMVREQVGVLSTTEMNVHQTFLVIEEEMKRMDQTQMDIQNGFEDVVKRLDKLLVANSEAEAVVAPIEEDPTMLYRATQEVQTDEGYFESPEARADFDPQTLFPTVSNMVSSFDENILKLMQFSMKTYNLHLHSIRVLKEQNAFFKAELSKKEEGQKPSSSSGTGACSSSNSRSSSRRDREKHEKKRRDDREKRSKDKESKNDKSDRRSSSSSRSRSSSSRRSSRRSEKSRDHEFHPPPPPPPNAVLPTLPAPEQEPELPSPPLVLSEVPTEVTPDVPPTVVEADIPDEDACISFVEYLNGLKEITDAYDCTKWQNPTAPLPISEVKQEIMDEVKQEVKTEPPFWSEEDAAMSAQIDLTLDDLRDENLFRMMGNLPEAHLTLDLKNEYNEPLADVWNPDTNLFDDETLKDYFGF